MIHSRFPTKREFVCCGGRKFRPHIAAWGGKQVRKRNFTMILPQPEFLSNLHQTLLQVTEDILFSLFSIELIIGAIQRIIRQCQKH
jgi:hypothetical protein